MNNKYCGKCRFFKPSRTDKTLGECRDALSRARMVVPFAINLEVTMVYSNGGKTCPTFELKNERTD